MKPLISARLAVFPRSEEPEGHSQLALSPYPQLHPCIFSRRRSFLFELPLSTHTCDLPVHRRQDTLSLLGPQFRWRGDSFRVCLVVPCLKQELDDFFVVELPGRG